MYKSQSTLVLCIQVNEKSCRLRMATYWDGVKIKGDEIGMELHNSHTVCMCMIIKRFGDNGVFAVVVTV